MIENLKSLAVFSRVAETGSFTAAAKALHLSAPVVSQHISHLEKKLDTALVYRTTRSLTLTDAGNKLAAHASQMLEAAESGFDELTDARKEPSGLLSIALPGAVADSIFMDGLAEYIHAFPKVHLRLSFDDNLKDLVREGYDVGIRAGELPDSNMKARKILQGQLIPAATPELIKSLPSINNPSDLERQGLPWINSNFRQRPAKFKRRNSNQFQTVTPQPIVTLDSMMASARLLERGIGIGFVPKFHFVRLEAEGILVNVLPEWEEEPIDVYAVWPANSGSRSLSRHFVTYLVETFLAERKGVL